MRTSNFKFTMFGLGPIGIEILRSAYKVNQDSIIGAVDIDPNKVGKDIGNLIGTGKMGITVSSDIDEVSTCEKHPIAIHATGSNLKNVLPQIKMLLDKGYSVVTTCEQFSFPWHRYPELAKK